MSTARRVLGSLGEQEACRILEADGYRIVARNYRLRQGELDIVCERAGTLVFCEVKTRTTEHFGLPEEAVTWTKRRRIRQLAAEYLRRERQPARTVRFDVVSVMVSEGRVSALRHIVNAF
jgi:putative endonuclease